VELRLSQKGHVAVSTETPRYISFSESLVRYVLHTLIILLAPTLYARVIGEREKLVTIQLRAFRTSQSRCSDTEVLGVFCLLT